MDTETPSTGAVTDYKAAWERRLRDAEASNQFTDNDQSIRWAGNRITELEADNKRLREALKAIIDDAAPDGELGGNHRVDTDLIYDAAEVLAAVQEEE